MKRHLGREGRGGRKRKATTFLKRVSLGAPGELATPMLSRPEGASKADAVYCMSPRTRPQKICTGFTPKIRLSPRMTEYV